MPCEEVGGGELSLQELRACEADPPHLAAGEEQAGSQAGSALPQCAPAGAQGATRSPSTPGSTAPLLTPSAFLIDANGSVRWGETALVLSYANSKFKKSQSSSGLSGAVDGSHTPPPASSALAASPQLAAAGAKNQSGAGRDRAHRQTKTSPRAQPQSGSARKAVTRKWHSRKGVLPTVFRQGIFFMTS